MQKWKLCSDCYISQKHKLVAIMFQRNTAKEDGYSLIEDKDIVLYLKKLINLPKAPKKSTNHKYPLLISSITDKKFAVKQKMMDNAFYCLLAMTTNTKIFSAQQSQTIRVELAKVLNLDTKESEYSNPQDEYGFTIKDYDTYNELGIAQIY